MVYNFFRIDLIPLIFPLNEPSKSGDILCSFIHYTSSTTFFDPFTSEDSVRHLIIT